MNGTVNHGRLHAESLLDDGGTPTDAGIPGSPTLTYTQAEWDAFHAGALAGELRGNSPRDVPVAA